MLNKTSFSRIFIQIAVEGIVLAVFLLLLFLAAALAGVA